MLYALNTMIENLFERHPNLDRITLHAISHDQVHLAKMLSMKQIANFHIEATGRTLWMKPRTHPVLTSQTTVGARIIASPPSGSV